MNIPLLDLTQQFQSLKSEIMPKLEALCDSQHFILGPAVDELEAKIAAYCQAGFGCGVSSGSDALIIALMCENIGNGDEVITTPYTFFATAGAVCRVGAKPVFVDIDPVTYDINPAQIEAKITERTRAIIPVHLYGQCADMDAIMAIARKHDLVVIEDACQAIGAECNGHRAGSIGDYGCLSFFPSKNLGGFGDGGMTVCNDAKRSELLHVMRNHGMAPQYHHHYIGGNFRIDAMQAAVLLCKLPHLDDWTAKRQKNAADYAQLLGDCDEITLPTAAPYATRHVFNQIVIRIANGKRNAVWDGLKAAGIGCAVYYPIPLHLQECFASLGYKAGDFPESERAANETLAIPSFPELTDEQKEHIAKTIKALLK